MLYGVKSTKPKGTKEKDFAVANVMWFLNNNSDPDFFPARHTSDQVPQHQGGGTGALMWTGLLCGGNRERTHTHSAFTTWLTRQFGAQQVASSPCPSDKGPHQTPPKWLSSSLEFPANGSLPTI